MLKTKKGPDLAIRSPIYGAAGKNRLRPLTPD